MTPIPSASELRKGSDDVGTVNQAVLTALLARDWAELERLVPRQPIVDPCPDLDTPE